MPLIVEEDAKELAKVGAKEDAREVAKLVVITPVMATAKTAAVNI